ncbi:hypothetical protein TYRP_012395, partial [Tyrophagus putrescentiae]
ISTSTLVLILRYSAANLTLPTCIN